MQKEFCIIDDKGNHFWVKISDQPPLWARGYGKRCKGAQLQDTIWIRDGLGDEKTDEVLRHEIAHPRVSRFRGKFNPLRNRALQILAVLLFIGGPVYYFVFDSFLLTGISAMAFILYGLYVALRTVDSEEHEEAVDVETKGVSYRIHDHPS